MNAGSALPPDTSLLSFVTDLLRTGNVVVAAAPERFTADDLRDTATLLAKFHRWDAMSMPGTVPAFDPEAAIWAAKYVYHALQLLLVRHLGPEVVAQLLKPFDGLRDAEAIYSADLCLRHLPAIYAMARTLSPADPLVTSLAATARDWPFSSIGIPIDSHPRFEHMSLRIAYADRVLAARDRKRAAETEVNLQLQVAIGDHRARLWTDFEPINPDLNEKWKNN